jgi:predicted RNA polymerase sigma factor
VLTSTGPGRHRIGKGGAGRIGRDGARTSLEAIDAAWVAACQPCWVVDAGILRAAGQEGAVRDALHRALGLTEDLATRAFLRDWLDAGATASPPP